MSNRTSKQSEEKISMDRTKWRPAYRAPNEATGRGGVVEVTRERELTGYHPEDSLVVALSPEQPIPDEAECPARAGLRELVPGEPSAQALEQSEGEAQILELWD